MLNKCSKDTSVTLLKDPKRELTDEIFSTSLPDSARVSEDRAAEYYRSLGYNVRFTHQLCYFDLYVTRSDGSVFLVEVKNHPRYKSTTFPDNTCEYIKYKEITRYTTPDKIVLFNIYSDNKAKISYFSEDFELTTENWVHTKHFADKRKRDKLVMKFYNYKVVDIPPKKL